MHMETLERSIAAEGSPQTARCREMVGLIRDLGQDLRHVMSRLRPPILDDMGIDSALESHCADVEAKNPGLTVNFVSRGLKERLSPDLEIVLFRVCQEALTNVVKHACANRVNVLLTVSFPNVILSIQDDGVGFNLSSFTHGTWDGRRGFGLLGMRERVGLVGGTMRFHTAPGKGTRVRAEIPSTAGREDP